MLISATPAVVVVACCSSNMEMELTLAVVPSLYHETLPFVLIVMFSSDFL